MIRLPILCMTFISVLSLPAFAQTIPTPPLENERKSPTIKHGSEPTDLATIGADGQPNAFGTPTTQPATTQPANTNNDEPIIPEHIRPDTDTKHGNPTRNRSDVTPTDLATIGEATSPAAFGHPKAEDTSKISLLGMNASSNRIVYLVDASGSMSQYYPFLLKHIQDSYKQLKEHQHFNVIFFTQRGAVLMFDDTEDQPAALMPANADNVMKADKFMKSSPVSPSGGVTINSAFKRAIELKPDLIFLVSDNHYGNGQSTIIISDLNQVLDKLNVQKEDLPNINVIQWLRDKNAGNLQAISDTFNGQYKFISKKDIGVE